MLWALGGETFAELRAWKRGTLSLIFRLTIRSLRNRPDRGRNASTFLITPISRTLTERTSPAAMEIPSTPDQFSCYCATPDASPRDGYRGPAQCPIGNEGSFLLSALELGRGGTDANRRQRLIAALQGKTRPRTERQARCNPKTLLVSPPNLTMLAIRYVFSPASRRAGWGSLRGCPMLSSHFSRGLAPQVGQRTLKALSFAAFMTA